MPCVPYSDGEKFVEFICFGNEPVEIHYNGRTYLFERSNGCPPIACNKDGSERRTHVPKGAWEALEAAEAPGGEGWCKSETAQYA